MTRLIMFHIGLILLLCLSLTKQISTRELIIAGILSLIALKLSYK